MIKAFNKGQSSRYIERGADNRESKIMWKKYTIFRNFRKRQRLKSRRTLKKIK